MSTIQEHARDFWDRISPRERGLVVIAAIAAPITIVIWLGPAAGPAGGRAEPLALETYLTNAATAAGFQLKGTTPKTPGSRPGFVINSVSLNVTDLTLEQLKRFLQEIEGKSKYVAVTHLDRSEERRVGKE